MTEAETYVALTSVFREVFDDDGLTIHAETTADDIPGWDSVTNITLIVAAEQRFDISFRTAEVESLRNIGEFIQLIQLKRRSSNRQGS
jgi:acyl carrier protein